MMHQNTRMFIVLTDRAHVRQRSRRQRSRSSSLELPGGKQVTIYSYEFLPYM